MFSDPILTLSATIDNVHKLASRYEANLPENYLTVETAYLRFNAAFEKVTNPGAVVLAALDNNTDVAAALQLAAVDLDRLHVVRADTVAALHRRLTLAAPHAANAIWKAVAGAFNTKVAELAEAVKIVDPASSPESLLGASVKSRNAWLAARTVTSELDTLASDLLSVWRIVNPSAPNITLPGLVLDLSHVEPADIRSTWAAFDSATRWTALAARGALSAAPSMASAVVQPEPPERVGRALSITRGTARNVYWDELTEKFYYNRDGDEVYETDADANVNAGVLN